MSLITTILGSIKDNINKVEVITEGIASNVSAYKHNEHADKQKLQNLLTAPETGTAKAKPTDKEKVDLAQATVDLISAQRNIAANAFTIKTDNETQKFLFKVR